MRKAKNEVTRDPIVLKILEQLKVQNRTEKEMEAALGFGNGTFTRWKYMNGKSYMNHIKRIAEYLNVTVEYLLSEENQRISHETMTASEIRLIMMYRKMEEEKRECLLNTAEFFMYSKKDNSDEIET